MSFCIVLCADIVKQLNLDFAIIQLFFAGDYLARRGKQREIIIGKHAFIIVRLDVDVFGEIVC